MILEPRGVGGTRLGEDHLDLRERLPHLELRGGPCRPPQRRDLANERHPPQEVAIGDRLLRHRVVHHVHAVGHSRGGAAACDGEIPPDRLGHERHEGRGQFRHREERLVERPVGVELVTVGRGGGVGPPRLPEAITAAADVPVAHGIDESREPAGGAEVVVAIHPLDDLGVRRRDLREHPTVEFAPVGHGRPAPGPREVGRLEPARIRQECRRVEAVDPGVDHEERVDVPQP